MRKRYEIKTWKLVCLVVCSKTDSPLVLPLFIRRSKWKPQINLHCGSDTFLIRSQPPRLNRRQGPRSVSARSARKKFEGFNLAAVNSCATDSKAPTAIIKSVNCQTDVANDFGCVPPVLKRNENCRRFGLRAILKALILIGCHVCFVSITNNSCFRYFTNSVNVKSCNSWEVGTCWCWYWKLWIWHQQWFHGNKCYQMRCSIFIPYF